MAAVPRDEEDPAQPDYEAPALIPLGAVGEVTLDEPSIVR